MDALTSEMIEAGVEKLSEQFPRLTKEVDRDSIVRMVEDIFITMAAKHPVMQDWSYSPSWLKNTTTSTQYKAVGNLD